VALESLMSEGIAFLGTENWDYETVAIFRVDGKEVRYVFLGDNADTAAWLARTKGPAVALAYSRKHGDERMGESVFTGASKEEQDDRYEKKMGAVLSGLADQGYSRIEQNDQSDHRELKMLHQMERSADWDVKPRPGAEIAYEGYPKVTIDGVGTHANVNVWVPTARATARILFRRRFSTFEAALDFVKRHGISHDPDKDFVKKEITDEIR